MPDTPPSSSTSVSEAMEEIQERAQKRADGEEAEEPSASDHDESTEEDDLQPDAADEKVLRWGRYVIEHFSPKEGDVLLIKGPRGEEAAEYREMMAKAIIRTLEEKGIENYQIIRGPSHKVNISQISEEQMRELGYVRKSDATPIPSDL